MDTTNPNDPSEEEVEAGIIRTTTEPNAEPEKPEPDEKPKKSDKKS